MTLVQSRRPSMDTQRLILPSGPPACVWWTRSLWPLPACWSWTTTRLPSACAWCALRGRLVPTAPCWLWAQSRGWASTPGQLKVGRCASMLDLSCKPTLQEVPPAAAVDNLCADRRASMALDGCVKPVKRVSSSCALVQGRHGLQKAASAACRWVCAPVPLR